MLPLVREEKDDVLKHNKAHTNREKRELPRPLSGNQDGNQEDERYQIPYPQHDFTPVKRHGL